MGKDEFLEAARQENLTVLEKFLQSKARKSGPFTSLRRGPGANIQDGSGFTALHHAAVNGHREGVSLLLRYEASVNIQDNKGSTPLHLAAWGGHLDVVKAITQQGPSLPNINHQNNGGETALHCASQYGHIDVVRLLLAQKADPTLPSLKAETPLDLASQFGHLNVVELLIREARLDLLRPYSAEAATAAVFPHTPLHLASRNGHLGVVKVLIKHGHNVNVRTSRGSPLHEAAICGKVQVVRTLMEAGADPGVRSDVGKTVLDTIAQINTPVTKQILGIIKSMHTILIDIEDNEEDPPELHKEFRSSITSKTSSVPSSGMSFMSLDSPGTQRGPSSLDSESCPTSPDPEIPLCASFSPVDFGGIYENVLVPTVMHTSPSPSADEPATRRTIGRRSKQKTASNSYRHSDATFRPISRERRYSERENRPPDTSLTDRYFDRGGDGRLSDRDSRFSDRDSCGRLSDRESRLSDLEDRSSVVSRLSEHASDHSYIYDVPPPARPKSSNKSKDSGKDKTAQDEDCGHPMPRVGPPLRHHKWKSECSPLDQSTKAVPPPKPPRRSICPPSPSGDRVNEVHNSYYEPIFFTHSNKKSDNELLDEPTPKRLSMPSRTGSVDHSIKKPSPYSSDSDSDTGRRPVHKRYQPAKFGPVKAERLTKRNAYENITPTPPQAPPPLPVKKYQKCLIVKSRSSNSPDAFRDSDDGRQSPTNRSRSDFSTFAGAHKKSPVPWTVPQSSQWDSDRESPPKTLDLRTESPETTDQSESQETRVPSAGVSPIPSSPDHLRDDAVSSCSLSSGASLSERSASTDNIEEIKSEIPFAGLYRGSRVPDQWLDDMHKDNNFASNTFKSLDKGCSGSLSLANNINNNTKEARERGSVLSPLDEAEEWARIHDIMSSFGGGLARESVFMAELEKEFQQRLGLSFPPSQTGEEIVSDGQEKPVTKHETVGSWLRSFNLGQYDAMFMSHGFDNLNHLNGLLDQQDLKEMGMTDNAHVEKILKAVEVLPSTPSAGNGGYQLPPTLKEWLESIKLTQYVDTFVKHGFSDMERVHKVWEVELSVVLEISRTGHRKRMLASLGDRPIEPQLPLSMTPQDLGQELIKLNTDISELKRKLFKELPESSSRFRRLPESNSNTIKRANTKRRAAPPPPPPRNRLTKSVSQSSSLPAESIALREPSELAAEQCLPQVATWKHAPTKLLSSSLRYVAEYLGSTHVKELKGTQSTISSIQKLKRSSADSADVPQILLSVSYFGVKFIDTVSESVVCEHEIRNIHCASQHGEDLTHFAYITKDVKTDSHYCHVFRVQNKELASEIVMTIGQAFEVAFQVAIKSQGKDKKREQPVGHTRTASEPIGPPHKNPSHNRCQSTNAVSSKGTAAPKTSMENLLSDREAGEPKSSSGESTGSPPKHTISNGN